MRELRLTDAERRTLRRAQAILERARELIWTAEQLDMYLSEIETDIALAAYTCEDLADSGKVDL